MNRLIKKKSLSIFTAIVLVLALTVTALAAWPSFQNDYTNNGVIAAPPGANPPTAATTTARTVELDYAGTAWTGVDTTSVINNGYSYTLYNGGNHGACLAIVNLASPPSPSTKAPFAVIDPQAVNSFLLSTPYLDTTSNILYVATTWEDSSSVYHWNLWSVTGLPSTTPTVTNIAKGDGQANTPITGYGGYLYFGSYTGTKGGAYYQYQISSGNLQSYLPVVPDDFYWAGATVVQISGTDYVVFGGDNAVVYVQPAVLFANPNAGNVLALRNIGTNTPGAVRSSIMNDTTNQYVYFTSQGSTQGVLWQVGWADLGKSNTANGVNLQTPTASTSTPVLSDNNIIYVGTYDGSTFATGSVEAYTPGTATTPPKNPVVIYNSDPVQASMIVWSTSDDEYNYDYVYFTTNSGSGAGRSYEVTLTKAAQPVYVSSTSAWAVLNTSSSPYSLQGMAYSDDGYVVWGDDGNNLYIVP
jgi:hypothetical protein